MNEHYFWAAILTDSRELGGHLVLAFHNGRAQLIVPRLSRRIVVGVMGAAVSILLIVVVLLASVLTFVSFQQDPTQFTAALVFLVLSLGLAALYARMVRWVPRFLARAPDTLGEMTIRKVTLRTLFHRVEATVDGEAFRLLLVGFSSRIKAAMEHASLPPPTTE